MPPLPTIGNAVRVTFNWSSSHGVTPRNVIHLITASDDATQLGSDLDDAFGANSHQCFQAMDDSYFVSSYSILFLDGTTATHDVLSDGSVVGGGSGEQIPAAAAVLSLRTLTRGPRGRGRCYIGPVSEAALTDGIIVESYRLEMIAGWEEANDTLAASDSLASLGVVSYKHAEIDGVTSISMRQPAGTQRRRQNQLVH